MRIGIDLRKIHDSGIGRYSSSLVHYLLDVDRENRYFLFLNPKDMRRVCFPGENVERIPEYSGKYSAMEHVTLPIQAARLRLDLFHAPHYVLPMFLPCKTVVTIHDLIHLIRPTGDGLTRTAKKIYAEKMIRLAAWKADRIIVVSEHTKKDLLSLVPGAEKKVSVIHNGIEWQIGKAPCRFHKTKGDETNRVLGKYGLGKGYLLFVGSDKVHKNLGGAVRCARRLWDEFKIPLVVVGVGNEAGRAFIGPGDPSLFEVHFLDQVEPEDMIHIYNGAYILLFSSYYEGFGLPILEAMACGVPVIASNRSSIPEVAGNAAQLVDPDKPEEMIRAARNLLSNALITQEYVERGFQQIKKFSWADAAKKTLEIYRSL